jgi:hypothetical protein
MIYDKDKEVPLHLTIEMNYNTNYNKHFLYIKAIFWFSIVVGMAWLCYYKLPSLIIHLCEHYSKTQHAQIHMEVKVTI